MISASSSFSGRTIAAIPEARAARTSSSMRSTDAEVCSQSSMTASTPRPPKYSTRLGELKIRLTMMAGVPLARLCLRVAVGLFIQGSPRSICWFMLRWGAGF